MTDAITGYAVVFGTETVIAGSFREKISPTALDRTLRDRPDVVALISHDISRVLGRTSAGTLSLKVDRAGLYFVLEPDPTTPDGQTALGNVARKDVKGCSFGFVVRAEEWQDGGDKLPLRVITDCDLLEITLTAWPAYESTSAGILDRAERSPEHQARLDRARAKMRARGIMA